MRETYIPQYHPAVRPDYSDFADKSELKRGRIRRRILRFVGRVRAFMAAPKDGGIFWPIEAPRITLGKLNPLPHGMFVMRQGGMLYVKPVPSVPGVLAQVREEEDVLAAAVGLRNALMIVAPIWGYIFYRMFG